MSTKNSIPAPAKDKSKEELYAYGRSLRKKCPRTSHATVGQKRQDPVQIHKLQTKGRIGELLPIYFERMLESPFAYYRGAASVMAADLAVAKSTGLSVQVCGDCHLLNFGGFATPERKIIFDINDFDETCLAPWEWDLKRLATSFAIAGNWKKFNNKKCRKIAKAAIDSYQQHIQRYAEMTALEVWYSSIDYEALIHSGSDSDMKRYHMKRLEKAMELTPHEKEFKELTETKDGKTRIIDEPPLLFHVKEDEQALFQQQVQNAYNRYLETLSNDRRTLLEQYKIQDVAMKVVGVGSVGTWCGVVLLMSDSGDPLFLQFKEAHHSVLEQFAGNSEFKNHGQRVVEGQKLMQSASDIFLGWTTGDTGRDFYVRQLRDAKIKPSLEIMDHRNLAAYAATCGWALAQAHARSGSAAAISGYIGKGGKFGKAIVAFAEAYQQRNENDYQLILNAVKEGDLTTE
jgi:uncharacterized protein (DUF2252 family)